MNELPQPFTPADCDLRGLPFMPLEVIRLLQSTTFALSTGDEFKAAFALWCASWLEVPAASLPDDDRMLEYLSKAKAWKKVRAVAMRGWIACADGRLYHPVVAKNAIEAWDRRVEYREVEDNKNERQRRWRERCKQLSDRLRGIGITPPKGASLETLETLLRDAGVDIESSTDASHVDGVDDGETSTVDKGEMHKTVTVTGTVKRQGQGQKLEKPGAAKSEPLPESKRATRLPSDWQLPKAWGEWALTEQPTWSAAHVRKVAEQFRDHWIAKPGADACKLDWEATWRNWIRREKPLAQGASSQQNQSLEERQRASNEEAKKLLFGSKGDVIDV